MKTRRNELSVAFGMTVLVGRNDERNAYLSWLWGPLGLCNQATSSATLFTSLQVMRIFCHEDHKSRVRTPARHSIANFHGAKDGMTTFRRYQVPGNFFGSCAAFDGATVGHVRSPIIPLPSFHAICRSRPSSRSLSTSTRTPRTCWMRLTSRSWLGLLFRPLRPVCDC